MFPIRDIFPDWLNANFPYITIRAIIGNHWENIDTQIESEADAENLHSKAQRALKSLSMYFELPPLPLKFVPELSLIHFSLPPSY